MGFSVLSFIVFIFTLLIYRIGVSPSVFGGDSGDVILASWFGGVAHPPGYPLNTMIGYFFTHLPISATVAYKAGLMSAVLMAVTIAAVFLVIKILTKNPFISLVSALTLAFNPLFWLYAHTPEVFQLLLMLVSVSIYFLFSWRESVIGKKPKRKLLYLGIIFYGLSFFHHQMAILLAPSILYLLYKTDKSVLFKKGNLIKLAGAFLIGFLSYIFIPFAAARHTPINWDNPSTLSNFIRLITRADYGTFVASGDFINYNLKQRIAQIFLFLLFIKADFTVIGLLLTTLGGIYCFLKERVLLIFLLSAAFFSGPFFFFYSSFAINDNFLLALWERFALLSYFFITILLGFGLLVVWKFLYNFLKKVSLGKIRTILLISLVNMVLLILPLTLFYFNFQKSDLHNFYLGDWLGHDLLASSEPNSIVFITGDTSSFNSHYVYYTTGIFGDRKLIKAGSLKFIEYRKQLANLYPDLQLPVNFLTDQNRQGADYIVALIIANFDKFPIYSSGFNPDIEAHKWFSVGLLKKLFKTDGDNEEIVSNLNKSAFSRLKFDANSASSGYSNFMTDHLKEIYYYSIVEVADSLISINRPDEATGYLDKAKSIFANKKDVYIRMGNIFFSKKDCNSSLNYFNQAFVLDKKDWQILIAIAKVYKECLNNNDLSEYFLKQAEDLKGITKNFKGL